MAEAQSNIRSIVIAVDGPAASGKGTIARALARRLGLPHMDTGLLYRAVALNLWRWGGDPASEFEALRACAELGFDPDDPELRSEPVSKIASAVSAYPSVRAALLERQQDFAGQSGGAVLDGRDIGTVVAPRRRREAVRHRLAGGARRATGSRIAPTRDARSLRGCPRGHPDARRARRRARGRAAQASPGRNRCWIRASSMWKRQLPRRCGSSAKRRRRSPHCAPESPSGAAARAATVAPPGWSQPYTSFA